MRCFSRATGFFPGAHSPYFQPSFFSKTSCFSWGSDGILERRIPGKNGEAPPRFLLVISEGESCFPSYLCCRNDVEQQDGEAAVVEKLPELLPITTALLVDTSKEAWNPDGCFLSILSFLSLPPSTSEPQSQPGR